MIHLQKDLDLLKKQILELGSLVETLINNAIVALHSRRKELAEQVLRDGQEIDLKEVHIEEECLKILALHQPVAVDLRFIVVVLKVNNDLERMGDFAENLAQRALYLSGHEPIPYPDDFSVKMADQIKNMVRLSLDCLVELNTEIANQVIEMDDVVDNINRKMYAEMQELMERDPSTVKRAVQLISASRYLERIGDLTTNIAEDVIFMVEGEVVRHQEIDLQN